MRLIFPALFSLLLLAGCGSSGKSVTATDVTNNQVTTDNSQGTDNQSSENSEVHIIQPDDIADYLDNFKLLVDELSFQLDGKNYPISFVDMDMEQNLIFIQFELGVIVAGFDINAESALPNLSIYQSDSADINETLDNPTAILSAETVNLSQSGQSSVYEASVTNSNTQASFNARLVINEALISGGSSKIEVVDSSATITGDLGTNFYIQLTDLINQHPAVDTLVLQNIGGSVNDAINMHSGRLVRNAQLTTLMPSNGEAYSGGVDLYAAGFKRVYQQGGKLGVHSWCCVDGKHAGELEKDHSAHGAQLTYVREMLGTELGPEFYFFTLESAPFDGIHLMTQAEIDKYFMADQ